MRKARYVPAAAVVGGILGLILRQLYLRRGFEPDTGLPIPDSVYGAPMWVFCVVLALALLFLSGGKHECFPKRYTAAFAPPNAASKVALLGSAFLLAAAGFLHLWSYANATEDYLGQRSMGVGRLVLGVLALAAAAAVFLIAQALLQDRAPNPYHLSMPGIAACFWVVANYQDWAKDPFIDRYMLELFAVILAMIAVTITAGFGFGNGSVSGALFFSGEAAAFCIMILGDGLPVYDMAMALAMVFLFLSQSIALSVNDGIPQPPPPPEEDGDGTDSQNAPPPQGCAGCPSAGAEGAGCPQDETAEAPEADHNDNAP